MATAVQVLRLEAVLRRLPLSTLLQTCQTTKELSQPCSIQLQTRAQKLAPQYPFNVADPVNSMLALLSQITWPWTQPVDIGDELYLPLEEMMFRAGLANNQVLANYLLTQQGEVEAWLFGLLYGQHYTAFQAGLNQCLADPALNVNQVGDLDPNINQVRDPASSVSPSCSWLTPQPTEDRCRVIIHHCREFSDVQEQLSFFQLTSEPWLTTQLLSIIADQCYWTVLRYWYERTPNPQVALNLLINIAMARGYFDIPQRLVQAPFWFRPPLYTALSAATQRGTTELLDMLIPAGGSDVGLDGTMIEQAVKSTAPGGALVRQYYRERGGVWSDRPDFVQRTRNAAIAQGSEPLLDVRRQGIYAVDLVQQASQLSNWELVRQVVLNHCVRSPYLLATTTVLQPQTFTTNMDHLFQLYQQWGLLTPAVLQAILFLDLYKAQKQRYMYRPELVAQVDLNKILQPTSDAEVNLLIQQQRTRIDPRLQLRLLLKWDALYAALQAGLTDETLIGQAIMLLSGFKVAKDQSLWELVVILTEGRRANDSHLARFLLLLARYIQDPNVLLVLLGSRDITREPQLLQQIGDILCERYPAACTTLRAELTTLANLPMYMTMSFTPLPTNIVDFSLPDNIY